MSRNERAEALARAESALVRRPALGLHDDAAATAVWQREARVVSHHAGGCEVTTDMPAELGGGGLHVTPGWLFRAGLAACFATTIAMVAARRGVVLDALSVKATSRSDTRGLLGMTDDAGMAVYAGPDHLVLQVSIAAAAHDADELRALVEACRACSPIPSAVRNATPIEIDVRVG